MADYINKGKNLKTKPIGSSNKNKCMAYYGELPFGILSYCRYIDLDEYMNTDFSELNQKRKQWLLL